MKRTKCVFCGKPGTLLCDFILGFEIKGWTPCNGQAALNADRLEEYVRGKGLPYTSLGSACFTCDAPLCEACARLDGYIFFDGDAKHTAIERVDKCPLHQMARERTPLMTPETAEKIRTQLWGRRLILKAMEEERR